MRWTVFVLRDWYPSGHTLCNDALILASAMLKPLDIKCPFIIFLPYEEPTCINDISIAYYALSEVDYNYIIVTSLL